MLKKSGPVDLLVGQDSDGAHPVSSCLTQHPNPIPSLPTTSPDSLHGREEGSTIAAAAAGAAAGESAGEYPSVVVVVVVVQRQGQVSQPTSRPCRAELGWIRLSLGTFIAAKPIIGVGPCPGDVWGAHCTNTSTRSKATNGKTRKRKRRRNQGRRKEELYTRTEEGDTTQQKMGRGITTSGK
ncbi:hypothetical protein Pmani_035352 [Petrolisthes manimaculis]|uniref:Uncharacterized protein n=1 Tax=Petrolisthes manimaculis TaxID=1843537 RepID=A0AAE1NN33_9EUCA|nr:hypothetical protein Pmani_035352 [Petrolisthes manimaculis]